METEMGELESYHVYLLSLQDYIFTHKRDNIPKVQSLIKFLDGKIADGIENLLEMIQGFPTQYNISTIYIL